MSQDPQHATRRLQFWIAALAITAINLSIWFVPRGSRPVESGASTPAEPAALRVRFATPPDLLARQRRFEMVLDQPAFAAEFVGRRFEQPPFRFDPAIEGVWEIVDRNTVSFVPAAEIGPGRMLRVVSDRTHPLFDEFTFDEASLPVLRYRPLTLSLMDLRQVTMTDDAPATATLVIAFNQPVRWSDLSEHLDVEVDGQDAKLEHTGDPSAERHEVTLPIRPGGQVTVAIDAALHGENDLLGLESPIRRSFRVAGRLTDLRAWAEADWYRDPEGRDRTIRIEFDRTLAAGQTPTIRIEPNPGAVRTRVWRDEILINGAFESGRAYKVTVDRPLMGFDRSMIEKPVVRSVRIPTPDPHLDFEPYEGQVIPFGRFELGLRHGGYPQARLRIHRLVDAHLPMILGEFIRNHRIPSASEIVFDGVIPLPQFERGHGTTALQLDEYMERQPGLYRIDIRANDSSWENDTATLLVSDLAIDLEVSAESTLAWITSIETGRPLEGVDVTAWAPNITETWTGTTGPDGLVTMPVAGDDARVVTARLGDDVVFLRPRRAHGLEDRALAGDAWPGPIDAAIYPERGIHRPGETLHLSAVVRTSQGDPVTSTPFDLRWIRPDGRVARTIEAVTDDVQGILHADVETESGDPTGRWVAALHLPGAEEPIARIECPVMPFLPVRLKVEATADEVDAGAAIEVATTTTYLHGAPAMGLPGAILARFTPTAYRDDRFPDFTFEPRRKVDVVRREVEFTLDESGRASARLDAPDDAATWNLQATVSAREIGGRATSATVERRLDNQGVHLGLRLPEGRIHLPGDPVPVEVAIVVVGEPATSIVPSLRLERIDRDWSYERIDGRWRWRSDERLDAIAIDPAIEVGTDRLTVVIPGLDDGEYRLTATTPAPTTPGPIASSVDFHVSRWQAEGRMNVERSDRIEIVPDVETIAAGATLPVMIRSPFPGTALVTVETDRVIDARVVEIAGDGVRVELPIPSDARDTAFVAATLVRPLDSDRTSWAPLLARGAARVRIDRTPHLLAPQIRAIEQARPGDVVRAIVDVPGASADAIVHLWAVEEGALLPTDHHAENPADRLLRDRRRTVTAISSIVDLVPEFDRTVQVDAIGGDQSAARREPVPVRLPETRVIWRTAERLGEDGVLEADLEMPSLDGAMRLMAVAVDLDRYGADEHLVGVIPAVQVVAALPRTAAPGDVMVVPVTLRNNLDHETDVSLEVTSEGGFDAAPSSRTVILPAGESTIVDLELTARRLGSIPVALRARAHDGDDLVETPVEWNIAVRPPFGMQRVTQRHVVGPGTTAPLDRDRRLDGFGGTVDVVLSGGPDIDLAPAVEELVDYPYGCGEQLGSRIEGLLAALLVDPAIGGADPDTIRSMAAGGFARLWETQTADGSIPYWSGGRGDDWLTARTAVLAVRAADRDVPMPGGFLPSLLRAAARIASNPQAARPNRLLAARALASSGLLDSASLEMLYLERDALGLAERAHLALALHRSGRIVEAMALVDTFTVPVLAPPTASGRFTSDITEAAIALSVGLEVLPTSPILPGLHVTVADGRGERRWRTTYETAASVEAIARWLDAHPAGGTASGTVDIAGRLIRFDGGEPVRVTIEVPPGSKSPMVERIVSDGDAPLFVTVTTSGIPTDDGDAVPIRRGLEIVRSWFDPTGAPIDPTEDVAAGRTVIVEVAYRSTLGAPIENVAIVDVLPSGFDLELPTLVTSAAGETTMSEVDHVEFRDDRVIVFDTATDRTQRFRYVTRAVVPGEWTRPGAVAESMYHDDVRGVLPNDRVRITNR